jgi:hypothetical protein
MSMLVRCSSNFPDRRQVRRVKRRLNEAGHWPRDGLEYHFCFGSEAQLKVSEIWASNGQFDAFGQQLGPILEEVGITQWDPPALLDIHNEGRL